jgi:hypothetical protein
MTTTHCRRDLLSHLSCSAWRTDATAIDNLEKYSDAMRCYLRNFVKFGAHCGLGLLCHVQFFNDKTKLSGVKSCPPLDVLLHDRLDESFDAASIGGTCGTCADLGCGKQLQLVEVV